MYIIKCLPDTKNYQKKLKSIELRKYPIKSERSFQCRKKSTVELFEAGLR